MILLLYVSHLKLIKCCWSRLMFSDKNVLEQFYLVNFFGVTKLIFFFSCFLNEFVKILIQFRLHKYAFTCDISKMFLIIRLTKGTYAMRFLWRDCNEEEEEKIYRMLVLAFDLNSSPYQAPWVTRRHAERLKKRIRTCMLIYLTQNVCR